MRYLLGAACFLLSSISILAQGGAKATPPEALLPADVLAYFRYDGYEPHRKAYDQTTLARLMKEDLSEFLEYLAIFARDQILMIREDEKKPGQREKAAAETSKFMEYFWQHGLVLGVEMVNPKNVRHPGHGSLPNLDPDALGLQATIVFPQGGVDKNRNVVDPFLHLLAGLGHIDIAEKKEGKRTIHWSTDADFKLAWWQEGDHIIVRLGSDPVRLALDVIEGRRPNLTTNPLFKNLTGFKNYETDMRGLVDIDRILDLVRTPTSREGYLETVLEAFMRHVLLHQVGANGVKALTFHLGFEGKFQRSTVQLHVVDKKQRSGLLRALSAPGSVVLDKLPALPPDAAAVNVVQVDWEAIYDFVVQTAKLASLAGAWPQGGLPRTNPFDLDALLGLDFRKDFLATLDSTVVAFNAHSEGPFILGQGLAIKTKDAKKLQESLRIMGKVLAGAMNEPERLAFQSRKYRGADLFILSSIGRLPFPPLTYTVHKDWLVIGLFPQPVQGFIFRSEGKYQTWQAPPYLKEILARGLREGGPESKLVGVSIVDPRPTFTIGLSLLPVIAQAISFQLPNRFDVSKIPNAQTINEFLYPSVSLFFDEGIVLRWEKHFAADLPTEGFFLLPLLWVLADF